MILPYQSLITYEEDNWNEFLNKICLVDVFKDLFEVVEEQDFKYAVKYIVWCYSVDSDSILLGTDWLLNKKKIFSKSGLPESYEDSFLYLKDSIVLGVINKWLNFQDNSTFFQVSVLKDLKVEMQLSSNSSIRKSSGEIDYDQKYKNANYASELTKKIKDLEMELIQNNSKLKDAVMEIKSSRVKNNLSPEMFAQ
jgi:hypothetical protein